MTIPATQQPVSVSAQAQASPESLESLQAEEGDQYSPVVASVFSTPRWFSGSDGQAHLVYELGVLNAFPVDVTLTDLVVLDGGNETPIATYTGDELGAITSLISVPATSTALLPASASGMIWLDISFPEEGDLPATLIHRLTV